MKRVIMWSLLATFFVSGARAGETWRSTGPDSIDVYPLQVAVRFTTNLIFPYRIAQVDIGSADVMGRRLGKADNVLLLKAAMAGFAATNVSVYLENGKLYSFLVSYADSLKVFNLSFVEDSGRSPSGANAARARVSGWPLPIDSMKAVEHKVAAAPGFLYVRAKTEQLRLDLRGVYLRDSILWLAFRGTNDSRISFRPEHMRFFVENTRRMRRTASQSVEWKPLYDAAPAVLPSGKAWGVAFSPKALPKGKRLVVVWRDIDGGRSIRLVIKGKYILRARALQ